MSNKYFKFDGNIIASCVYHNYSYYPNLGRPIVKNNVYTLGNTIIFELYNRHTNEDIKGFIEANRAN